MSTEKYQDDTQPANIYLDLFKSLKGLRDYFKFMVGDPTFKEFVEAEEVLRKYNNLETEKEQSAPIPTTPPSTAEEAAKEYLAKWGNVPAFLPSSIKEAFLAGSQYQRQQGTDAIREDGLWEFVYNDCVHEGGAVTISIHKTKEGAEKAMELHKEEERKIWQRLVDSDEDKGTEYGYENMCPFGQFKYWGVQEIKVME